MVQCFLQFLLPRIVSRVQEIEIKCLQRVLPKFYVERPLVGPKFGPSRLGMDSCGKEVSRHVPRAVNKQFEKLLVL